MDFTYDNYIQLKEQKLLRREIAEKFGLPEWKLKRLLSTNGWARKPEVINNRAFLDYSEESCYWAGFIAADGCVSNKGLAICLGYDDLRHLEKFRAFVQSNHKITTNISKYYRCEISFKAADMNEDLLDNYNITPNKSLTYQLPEIPDKWFKHYLRGYFDGDGCICETFKPKSNLATLLTTITGSKPFIEKLFPKISELVDILGGHIQEKENCSIINYSTNNSFLLIDYMYKDSSVYLDRKHALYNKLSSGIRKTR